METPKVFIHLLPGGIMPKRQTDGAIGFDAHVRAIVSPSEIDPLNPKLRKILFDFQNIPDDPTIAGHVLWQPKRGDTANELVYRMNPGESLLVGIGFVTEMPFPMFYWVSPRSGLSSRYGIIVTNAPGTVDPDYRGEAGVLVWNRALTTFDLRHGMRIAQIIFQWAIIPGFKTVDVYKHLRDTVRGIGGFGSTGLNK
jgi:dUTP pyrophosphatase